MEPAEIIKTPPHSLEAEQAVLGGLMLSPSAWDTVSEIVSEEDFYNRAHRVIFAAIAQLAASQNPTDALMVIDRLRDSGELEAADGAAYVGALPRNIPSAAHVNAYARTVKTKAQERRLAAASMQISELVWEDVPLAEKIDRAGQIVSGIGGVEDKGRTLGQILRDSVDALEERFNSEGLTGMPTGFNDLDEMLHGLHPSDLVIVAGRPSMGKTTFAMNIAEHAALMRGKTVKVFSLEMSDVQLVDRLQCSIGRIDYGHHLSGKLLGDEWERLTAAVGKLNGANIVIDDTPALSVAQVRARSRRAMREHGLDLIVVDYLQLMRGDGENRTNQISSISQGLKAIAKELNVPVIALSQLNRECEKRNNKRPMLSDLRDSGSIEQDADVIIFLYRDEVYTPDSHMQGIGEAIIRKQRKGRTGTVCLTFQGQFCRFDNFVGELPEEPAKSAGYSYA